MGDGTVIEVYTSTTLAILIGWTISKIVGVVAPRKLALVVGIIVGLAVATIARGAPPILYFTAILSPIAITVPLLAVRNFLQTSGISCPRFSKVELAGILVLYIVFLAASMGVISFDFYRLGYNPVWAGVFALFLIGYGAFRRNPFFPIIAIFGQVLWTFDIGSSNYFDHIGHVLLVPIIVVALLSRR